KKLCAISVVVVGDDRDTVVQLEAEGVNSIIYNYHILEGSVLYNAQVFDVDAILCLKARVPIEAMLDQLMSRVKVVQYDISVELMTCSEDHYLILFVCLSQALYSVWADIDSCLYDFTIGELDI